MQKHWYLGFLALIGFYKLPAIWGAIQGEASLFGIANLLWFLWLFYFMPADKDREAS